MAGVLSRINKLDELAGWRWRDKLCRLPRVWGRVVGAWGVHAGGCTAEAAEILHVTLAVAGGGGEGEAEGDRTVQKYLNIDYS